MFPVKRVFVVLEPAGDNEDYVADSEDEATKNFKDRVRIQGTQSCG